MTMRAIFATYKKNHHVGLGSIFHYETPLFFFLLLLKDIFVLTNTMY